MDDIYNNMGIEFEKMPFSVVDIPEEAGLMYLITPASGALSKEILDNIEDWLALGDRHLVVVGNDPIWEASGVYLNSNNIVNNLLRELGSRMVIQPARNQYEACLSGIPYQDNAISQTAVPRDVTTIPIVGQGVSIVGSGYGDIKLYDPDFPGEDWVCANAGGEGDSPLPYYWELNDRCNMPQIHLGDLRATWNDVCYDQAGLALLYTNSLAYGYGTHRAGCDKEKYYPPYKPEHEPRAIMAAAETPPPYLLVTPGIPEHISRTVVPSGFRVAERVWRFVETAHPELEFLLTDSQQSGISINPNVGITSSPSRYLDPDYYDGRDGLLQARATTKLEERIEEYIYQETFITMAEEPYNDNGSSVVLYAKVGTESKAVLDSNFGDINQNMYANLVGTDANGSSKVAQLGGWTDRAGFKSGYDKSVLHDIIRRNGNTVDQNVSMDELTLDQNGYNVAWIANSSGIMSESDLSSMKEWLDKGDKKLIITFGCAPEDPKGQNGTASTDIAQAVTNMCSSLGIEMKPTFLPERNRFAYAIDGDLRNSDVTSPVDWLFPDPESALSQSFTRMPIERTYVGKGFIGFDSSINSFQLNNSSSESMSISVTEKAVVHATSPLSITDDSPVVVGLPELFSGTAKMDIPVMPGSGYRIFFDTVAESPAETHPLKFKVTDAFGVANVEELVIPAPEIPEEAPPVQILDFNYITREQEIIDVAKWSAIPGFKTNRLDTQGTIKSRYVDVLVPSNISGISVYVQSDPLVGTRPISPAPRTPRLVNVSGALIDLELQDVLEPAFVEVETIIPAVPEQSEIIDSELRPISTGSTKYCPDYVDTNPDNGIACSGYFYNAANMDPLIADGPVVVAQEIYYNRAFEAGAERSRITVISDASLIEGKSILTPEGAVNPQLSRFLQSLYPTSPVFTRGGKQFVEYEKITSLERSSPHKLYANTGNSGVMMRFQGAGVGSSGQPLLSFTDKEDDLETSNRGSIYGTLSLEGGDPSVYLLPWDGPPRTPEDIVRLRNTEIRKFDGIQYQFGGTARFSGIYEGTIYTDAGPRGGTPEIMRDTGYDYLDFDEFPSGYPGDLFGYSISLFGKKLLVGSPFVAWQSEQLTDWAEAASGTDYLSGSVSGAIIGHNGGAGAAYLYELNADVNNVNVAERETRWGMTRKFRPSGINTGQDLDDTTASQAYKYLGLNSYTEEELKQLSTTSDMFGHDVDMQYDMLVISAPGHDFGNKITETENAFQRKSFNPEFDIQNITYTDLGSSGVRDALGESSTVLNQGVVFSYQNNITDWGSKKREWQDLQKIVPQGYNSNEAGVSENDHFGSSVSLYRGRRVDGDYTLAVGTPNQDYATSGNTTELSNAGASYTYEAMLRSQPPAVAESGTWMNASVYGTKPLNPDASMSIGFENGVIRNEIKQYKGRVLTDQYGQIFIEASGQDFADKGYVEHRPVIEAVQGYLTQGEEEVNLMRLSTFGRGPLEDGTISLYVDSEGGTVYNNIGMYTGGISGFGSGTMPLMAYCQSGILHTSTVNMVASGAGLNIDTLGLRTRGK
jgi:hypothetical protein